ncbi:MAG: flagellar export protein FliJ [Candidatus Accumulibacter sp.]|jgi:flagellar FliJ protein|nr:flagellar export protein FliJ [Accumulibacter sp.]
MTKPFPLQTILELMQERADEATRNLARLIANEKDAKARLDMLLGYRDEYAGRFREAAQNGLTQRQWRNYQQFLDRLDEAIEQQRKIVAAKAQNTALGQMQWQQQRKKLKAFDTLSERHFASENAREAKRDQKLQDEFAARVKGVRDQVDQGSGDR